MLQAKGIQPTERFNIIRETVLESEKLGYHSIWLDDHLMYNDWPILESWTALSALSSLTSRIRLGTMVTCSIHRNPALLAKVAATLDVISGGRLELGIGAGIQKQEHTAYGFDFPDLSGRVERLVEALEVIRRLWTDEKANYQGKHHKLKDAVCEPKPLQRPRPPFIVGGRSDLLIQKVTASYADRFDWGLLGIKGYKRKLAVLENQCKAIGRDFAAIERSCWPSGQILIALDKRELSEKITKFKPANVSLEEFRKTTLVGTPDECVEKLQVYRDLGVTCFMLCFADFPKLDCLRLFAQEVANRMDL
jgi:alkanesulfonate monooxygenase SsuD/methylene tetrahydromethanopterin reductase-like flavin-dependent oxidoreductase (luciferase family)